MLWLLINERNSDTEEKYQIIHDERNWKMIPLCYGEVVNIFVCNTTFHWKRRWNFQIYTRKIHPAFNSYSYIPYLWIMWYFIKRCRVNGGRGVGFEGSRRKSSPEKRCGPDRRRNAREKSFSELSLSLSLSFPLWPFVRFPLLCKCEGRSSRFGFIFIRFHATLGGRCCVFRRDISENSENVLGGMWLAEDTWPR